MFCKSLVATAALAMCAPAALARLPANSAPNVVDGEVLVQFKPNKASLRAGDAEGALGIKRALALDRRDTLLDGKIERLQLPGFMRVEDAVAQLRSNPNVLWAEPNYRKRAFVAIPNDPRFTSLYALQNTGANGGTVGADMNLPNAWDPNSDGVGDRVGDRSIKLAVIDDGFQTSHEDLAGNLIQGRSFNADGSESADVNPRNADETHGTLVAGPAGAVGNNGRGVTAPAWNVQLLPVRFAYDTATLVKAYDYARQQGAKVVNASFGGSEASNAERSALIALRDADVLVLAAAGNNDSNIDLASASFPAGERLPNVLAVAATNNRDQVATFSEFGPTAVGIAAPGVAIVTTNVGNTYATVSGTSFASPYAAGVAALLRMHLPSANYLETRARLVDGAESPNNLNRFVAGGRVDAANSFALSPKPSLQLDNTRYLDSGSGNGDNWPQAGESGRIALDIRNYWSTANGVTVTVQSNSAQLSPNGTSITVPALAQGATTTINVPVTVNTANQEVADLVATFRTAGGTLLAERHFNVSLGALSLGATRNAQFGPTEYAKDEFHTWAVQVPSGVRRLRFGSTTTGADIDILVKFGAPPRYNITLGVPPESGQQTFYTDVPNAQIGGEANGIENVEVNNPQAGTWYVTVVNYDQLQNLNYTLTVDTPDPAPGSSGGSSGGLGGGGGGSATWTMLAPLAMLAALRGRRRARSA